ncbi:hypothetical protein RF11_02261 [Thelohanellus kitauei]|uniref:Uncharacterized protein n=1 Tax=Thelohanellus kitauei TaxID=669202 RepID=A0A0C2J2Z4_THEKT|nr:hypothetical protein RF11_02261 [Thelohanellus kitauei]
MNDKSIKNLMMNMWSKYFRAYYTEKLNSSIKFYMIESYRIIFLPFNFRITTIEKQKKLNGYIQGKVKPFIPNFINLKPKKILSLKPFLMYKYIIAKNMMI